MNLLKVASKEPLSDATVANKVSKAIARDVVLFDEDFDVTVTNGVASLKGDVSSYFAREQAEDVCARVPGVKDIDNRLTVTYEVPAFTYAFHDWDPLLYDYEFDHASVRHRPDWEIRSDIESELWWSPYVDEDQVTVTVENGTAILTGTVDSRRERHAASENALEGGALSIINRLRIAERRDET